MFMRTVAWAPIRQRSPMTAPSRMIAPMPMSDSSPIVQAWMIAECPIVTLRPILTPRSVATWITALSWTLLSSPISMDAMSARNEADGQTLERDRSVTSPERNAPGAMKASGADCGLRPMCAHTILAK